MLHGSNKQPDYSRMLQLAKCICEEWSVADLKSKVPNRSPLYAALHEIQALLGLLQYWDTGKLHGSFHDVAYASALTSLQYLVRIFRLQNEDGSWGVQSSLEESAYGLLVLTRLSGLPFLGSLQESLAEAIARGRAFLTSSYPHRKFDPLRLWTKTVPFGSSNIEEIYTLVALQGQPAVFSRSGNVLTLVQIPYQRLPDLKRFYRSLPIFAETDSWIVRASLIEGYLLLPILRQDYTLYSEEDSYKWLEYISFIFPACNNMNKGRGVATETLMLVMGLMSILYQIDAFMEGLLERGLIEGLAEIVGLVHEAFGLTKEDNTCGVDLLAWSRGSTILSPQLRTPPISPSSGFMGGAPDYFTAKRLGRARSTLNTFVRFLLDHPAIASASTHDRHWFKTELYSFFIAQAGQVAEKATLAGQVADENSRTSNFERGRSKNQTYRSSAQTFHRWLSSTGADSVGSPYQFAFFSILLAGGTGRDCWESVEEKYLAQSASQALATVWRIENDIGGIARDRIDCTVNSVNFPELATQGSSDAELKEQLKVLAGHERRRWKKDMSELGRLAAGDAAKEDKLCRVGVFTDAMELYGQIYIERDVWRVKADE